MECNLGQGELIRLEGGATGLQVRCLSGALWLTQGDSTDYLVSAGRSFALVAGQTALVEALKPAEVRVGKPVHADGMTHRPVIGLAGC